MYQFGIWPSGTNIDKLLNVFNVTFLCIAPAGDWDCLLETEVNGPDAFDECLTEESLTPYLPIVDHIEGVCRYVMVDEYVLI